MREDECSHVQSMLLSLGQDHIRECKNKQDKPEHNKNKPQKGDPFQQTMQQQCWSAAKNKQKKQPTRTKQDNHKLMVKHILASGQAPLHMRSITTTITKDTRPREADIGECKTWVQSSKQKKDPTQEQPDMWETLHAKALVWKNPFRHVVNTRAQTHSHPTKATQKQTCQTDLVRSQNFPVVEVGTETQHQRLLGCTTIRLKLSHTFKLSSATSLSGWASLETSLCLPSGSGHSLWMRTLTDLIWPRDKRYKRDMREGRDTRAREPKREGKKRKKEETQRERERERRKKIKETMGAKEKGN